MHLTNMSWEPVLNKVPQRCNKASLMGLTARRGNECYPHNSLLIVNTRSDAWYVPQLLMGQQINIFKRHLFFFYIFSLTEMRPASLTLMSQHFGKTRELLLYKIMGRTEGR